MQKVRWGIVSTARIAQKAVIPAMQAGDYSTVAAIASRSEAQANKVAAQFDIPNVYGSYEALLSADTVDAVYIPLPNHLHVPVALEAIKAGKHVLVEKPLALTAEEGQNLADTAEKYPHIKVMEAFMYRYHSQWQEAVRLVRSGAIGAVRTIHSFFSYANLDPENVRNQAALGGGGLMDIGCYSISLSRLLFEAEPKRVISLMEKDPHFEVDCLTSAILDFGAGSATFTCSTQIAGYQKATIYGTDGYIELPVPFNPAVDTPCEFLVADANGRRTVPVSNRNQYTVQGDLLSKAILEDAPVPTPLSDGIANMRVLEALVQSNESGGWESP